MTSLNTLLDRFGIHRKDLPKIAGTTIGPCLVVGTARRVWEDLREDGRYQDPDVAVMAVNDMIMHYPHRLDHGFSNDPLAGQNFFHARRDVYRAADIGDGPKIHGLHMGEPNRGSSVIRWPWPGRGTSTLNAVLTAIALGYAPIIVAGAPLDESGHYYDPPWQRSNYTGEARFWRDLMLDLRGRVYGVSGVPYDLWGRAGV